MSLARRAWDAVPEFVVANDTRLMVALLAVISVIYALIAGIQASLADANVVNAAVQTVQFILFLSAVYGMMALALNLHWGYTGLFNIGVAGFMAVGVYASSMLAAAPDASPPGIGLPVPLALLGGVIAAAIVGGIAALPALQLEADYFAIVTVGFSEMVRLTLNADTFAGTVTDPELTGYNVVNLFGFRFGTGGGQGISTPFNNPLGFLFEGPLSGIGDAAKAAGAAVGVAGPTVEDAVYSLFLLVVVVSLYYVLLRRVGNSPFGRVLKAIREDELVASSLGKDTRLFKIKVFMLGCGLMGLAGVLWQGSRGFVNPNTFRPIVTFYVFTALIVGGAGSNTGSVVGGAVFAAVLFEGPKQAARLTEAIAEQFVTLPEPNSFYAAVVSLNPAAWLGYAIGNISYLKFMFLGAVLVYLMQNRPNGIMGHRKEPAASIDLTERPPREREPGGSPDLAADGRGDEGGAAAADGEDGGESDE